MRGSCWAGGCGEGSAAMRRAFVEKALIQGLGAPRRDSVPSGTGLRSADGRHSARSLSAGSAFGTGKHFQRNRVTSIKLYKRPLGLAELVEHPLQVDTGSDNHCSRWTHSLESDCGCQNRLRVGGWFTESSRAGMVVHRNHFISVIRMGKPLRAPCLWYREAVPWWDEAEAPAHP
jgi:hypothetical protein